MRPQTATGLIFHLGWLHAPPYLRLQMLEKQVSRWGLITGQGWDWQGPPDIHSPPATSRQVLLWADDGAGKFSTLVTLSKALCDGRWHQLAGEPGPLCVVGYSWQCHPPLLL